LKVYVASSWKNEHYPEMVSALRQAGFDVYDFRDSSTRFRWDEVFEPGQTYTAASYRKALAHPKSRVGYQGDLTALLNSDICVLCLPAGRSASWELGLAMGLRKGSIVYFPDGEQPDLMFMEAFHIVGTIQEVVLAAQRYQGLVEHVKTATNIPYPRESNA